MRKTPSLLLCLLLAAQAAAQPPRVEVPGTRTPVDKSYRQMLRGVDRFAQEHALAPAAELRFRLLPRRADVRMDEVELAVVGDSRRLPLPLAPDASFTLPRDEALAREDAAVLANRRTLSLTWRADVRSPGVPPGMRRLGDLRLECLVGMTAGLVSNNARLFAWLGKLLNSPERVCNDPDGNYLFFADRPLFAITLHDGARHAPLSWRSLYAGGRTPAAELPFCDCQVLVPRSYYAPLWDQRWPDDSLLSFEYADQPPPPDAAPAPGVTPGQSQADVAALLGPATALAFPGGNSVWLYPPTAPPSEPQPHFWVLFDAAGRVLKSRRWP